MGDEGELWRGSQWPSRVCGDKDNVTVAWVMAKLIPSKLATTVAICICGRVWGASSVEGSVCTPIEHWHGDGQCVRERDIGWRSWGVTAGASGVPH